MVRAIDEEALRDAALHYPRAGGKAIRPVLAVLACEACGGEAEDADPLALSVELLHTFSLVHDDLMDRDATRRGVDSVHVAFDEPGAILAGDVLFASAFEALSELGDEPRAMAVVSDVAKTARRLCEGQQRDMAFEHVWPSVDAYEAMIAGKTAALFACATGNGAQVAGAAPDVVSTMRSFGHELGMGFQIQDDVLDLAGDEDALGKPVGSDVRAGKKSHPILEAHERASPEQREELERVLEEADPNERDVDWVLDLARTSGALAASRQRSVELLDESGSRLASLPDGDAKATLQALVGWIVDRDR